MSANRVQTCQKSTSKKSLRSVKAGLVALVVLVGIVAVTVPSQAHSRLGSGSFTLNFSFGISGGNTRVKPFDGKCMSIWTIKDNMRSQGYRNVQYLGEWRFNKPEFSGVWNGWRYTMQVDRCTGQASNVQRAGRASRWSTSPFSNSFFEWFELNRQRR